MTAIAFPGSVVPSRTTRLRLTARGRHVLAALAALPVTVAVVMAVIGGSSALASDEHGAPDGSFTTVTVMSGDSLWSIAQQVAPHSDPRDVVASIERLNALDTPVLSAGQRLAIPAQYSAQQ